MFPWGSPYLRNKNCVTEKEETLLGKLLSISLIIILVLCFFLLFHFDIHYIFRFVSGDTFFYLCHVYEIRLKGIVKRTIKGYFQVMR